jgi:hypothetical protein
MKLFDKIKTLPLISLLIGTISAALGLTGATCLAACSGASLILITVFGSAIIGFLMTYNWLFLAAAVLFIVLGLAAHYRKI